MNSDCNYNKPFFGKEKYFPLCINEDHCTVLARRGKENCKGRKWKNSNEKKMLIRSI